MNTETTTKTVDERWWKDFFEGPFGDLQLCDDRREKTEHEVNRVCESFVDTRASILDAPCGAGRHSLELARRGHRVVGVDFNEKVLSAARGVAATENLDVEFRRADLRSLSTGEQFDVVVNLWTSIGYFGDEDNDRTFESLVRAVKPGGCLIVDTVTSELALVAFHERWWWWWGEGADKVRVCEERAWEPLSARVASTWTFFPPSGAPRSHETLVRVYSCREIADQLARLGFTSFDATASDGSPFGIGKRLWLVARKDGPS